MHILHFYHRDFGLMLSRGGVVRAVLDMAGLMAAAGHTVTILTYAVDDEIPADWLQGSPGRPHIKIIDQPTGWRGRFSQSQLRALTKSHLGSVDLLHLHGTWATSTAQLASLARQRNLPYVVSLHGLLDAWCMRQGGLKKRLRLATGARRMLDGAAAVHTTAQGEKDQALVWVPQAAVRVVPLLFDLAPFQTMPGPAPVTKAFPDVITDEPLILFLSRLHVKKGIELLIDAVADLEARSIPGRVVIAGGAYQQSYEDELQAIVKARGLAHRIFFLGFVTGIEKISLYDAADLFVLPTSQENFGFVLFEALAAGLAVITTKGADTWPEMKASGGAVIVDPDPKALADSMERLLADPDLRTEMGRNGRAWVFENLSAESGVAAFEDLYTSIVPRSPSS